MSKELKPPNPDDIRAVNKAITDNLFTKEQIREFFIFHGPACYSWYYKNIKPGQEACDGIRKGKKMPILFNTEKSFPDESELVPNSCSICPVFAFAAYKLAQKVQ